MKSSDLVAALSVLVAGVISPMIAMLSVRWQVSHTVRSNIESERRSVLDEAIVEISRFMRATSQIRAMWRHAVSMIVRKLRNSFASAPLPAKVR